MIPAPAYILSGPHLSGYRVTLGYATLAEAQDAHEAVSKLSRDDSQAHGGYERSECTQGNSND